MKAIPPSPADCALPGSHVAHTNVDVGEELPLADQLTEGFRAGFRGAVIRLGQVGVAARLAGAIVGTRVALAVENPRAEVVCQAAAAVQDETKPSYP